MERRDGSRRNAALQIDGAEAGKRVRMGPFCSGFKRSSNGFHTAKQKKLTKVPVRCTKPSHRSQPGVGSRSGLRSGAFKGAGDWTGSGCCPANSPVGLEPLTALCAADAGSAAGSTLSAAGVGAVTEASALRASTVFGVTFEFGSLSGQNRSSFFLCASFFHGVCGSGFLNRFIVLSSGRQRSCSRLSLSALSGANRLGRLLPRCSASARSAGGLLRGLWPRRLPRDGSCRTTGQCRHRPSS